MYSSFFVKDLIGVSEYYSLEFSSYLKERYIKRSSFVKKYASTFALTVGASVTGFIDFFQFLKIIHLAFFTVENGGVYAEKNINHLLFPHFEEYIIGICFIRTAFVDKKSLKEIGQKHYCIKICGNHILFFFRKPVFLDLEYVILILGELAPIKYFVHNKLLHQKLQSLSGISNKLNKNATVPKPVIALNNKTSYGQIVSLVNSKNKESYELYAKTIGLAIRKFGFFFMEVDICNKELNISDFKNSSLLIIGQQRIIEECSGMRDIEALDGVNILNCDYVSLLNNCNLRDRWLPEGKIQRYVSSGIKVSEPSFKINHYKIEKPLEIRFYKEKGIYLVDNANVSKCDDKEPSIFKLDSGRSFGIYRNITHRTKVFHYLMDQKSVIRDDAGSLNETLIIYKLFIINAAKKPLVVKECPRFLFLKLDDCTLEKSERHLEEIGKTGFFTNVGLLMFDVLADRMLSFREMHYPSIRFTPHAGGWKHSFWKNIIKNKDYHSDILNRNKEYLKAYSENFKIHYSPVTHTHFYSMGANAIPVLKDIGIKAGIMNSPPRSNNNHFVSMPMGHPSYGYGFYEEGFFYLNFEDYNKFKYEQENRWDFLKQCSKINGKGDVSKAVQRGYFAVRRAFLSGFPAILSTHEFRMLRFSPHEIREILEGILRKLESEKLAPVLMDDVSVVNYLKNYISVQFKDTMESNGSITMKATGAPSVNMKFTVYGKNGLSREVILPKGQSVLTFNRKSYV